MDGINLLLLLKSLMKMKQIVIVLILGISWVSSVAQTRSAIAEFISGKVINEVTSEPVSYTNIGLENTLIGTASDTEGKFQLGIPKDMVDRNIYFSALGFKNDTFPVSDLFSKEYVIIKMEPKSYDIENVDVAEKSRVLFRILRMAAENIPYNYIGGPFNFVSRYSNTKTVDDTINIQQDMQVLLYDKTGYSQPSKLDAYRWRNYSLNKTEQTEEDFTFSTGTTNLDELLRLDMVRTASSILDPHILDRFELELKSEPEIDGAPSWVIAFSEPEPTLSGTDDFYATLYEGEITITKEDYAVKKITGKVKSPKQNRQGKSLAIGPSGNNYFKNVDYSFEIVYSSLKPEYILLNRSFEYDAKNIRETSRLDIEKVQTTNVTELNRREYFTGE